MRLIVFQTGLGRAQPRTKPPSRRLCKTHTGHPGSQSGSQRSQSVHDTLPELPLRRRNQPLADLRKLWNPPPQSSTVETLNFWGANFEDCGGLISHRERTIRELSCPTTPTTSRPPAQAFAWGPQAGFSQVAGSAADSCVKPAPTLRSKHKRQARPSPASSNSGPRRPHLSC